MIRTLLTFVAGLGLAATATIAPAFAQDAPGGSYQQSCYDVSVRGDRLVATCNAARGGTVRSSIDLDSCRKGDIANNNGQLGCNRNRDRDGYRDRDASYTRDGDNHDSDHRDRDDRRRLPSGSYLQSCTNAHLDRDASHLIATCTAPDGDRITTSLDYHRCDTDIGNRNGRLTCRR